MIDLAETTLVIVVLEVSSIATVLIDLEDTSSTSYVAFVLARTGTRSVACLAILPHFQP